MSKMQKLIKRLERAQRAFDKGYGPNISGRRAERDLARALVKRALVLNFGGHDTTYTARESALLSNHDKGKV